MSQRTAYIIVVIVFLLALGGIVWYFVSLSDETRAPGEPPREGGFFSRLFPGGGGGSGTPSGETPGGGATSTPTPAPILRLVSQEPVAGAVAFEENDEIIIRYMERATSHVFETPAALVANTRILNMTLPSIQEALFAADGSAVVIRYLDERGAVKTFAGTLEASEEGATSSPAEYSLDGSFLPDDVRALARGDGEAIAFLLERGEGSVLYEAAADGTRQEQRYASPLAEWNIEWGEAPSILLVSKASTRAPGYAYVLAPGVSTLTRVIGGERGLTATLSPEETHLLYAVSTNDGVSLRSRNLESGETTTLPIETLPEKCAWSDVAAAVAYCGVPSAIERGDYPDVWYQGKASFSDNIWRIDAENGSAELVFSLEDEAGGAIDAVDLSLAPDDSYLLFINKRDLRLWSLELTR